MVEIELHFRYESAVVADEDGIIVFLSTDQSHFSSAFTVIASFPMDLTLALQSIYSPLLPTRIPLPPDRRDYKKWLEEELLRRVSSKTGMDVNFDPVKKEDYDTIKSRREDLFVRVRSQMSHLSKVKSLMPLVKKRQNLLWREYTYPYLALLNEVLFLSVYTKNTVSSLILKTMNQPFYSGLVEFSIPFLEALDASHVSKISITNISPSRKHVESIPRIVLYPNDTMMNLQRSFMLFYLINQKSVGRSVDLTRVELFDLLSRIRIHDPNTILRITISSSKSRGDISLKGENVRIKIGRRITGLEFSCPLHLLQSFIPITYMVTNFRIISTLIGVAFVITTENFTITKTYISDMTHLLYDLMVIHAKTKMNGINPFLSYFAENAILEVNNMPDESNHFLIPMFLEGKIGYCVSDNTLFQTKGYELLTSKSSSIPHLAPLLTDLVKRSKYEYSLEFDGHSVTVLIADLLKYSCTCTRICIYLKALLLILLEERGYG